ncbi:MAG: SMC-Scp complex subunit ScpB [Nitrospirae bacterium GWB2_47_37]|nr:MAG: SMC-Scp complex subunit ScpB [Nitrospirae bacterium GWB2_47_37]HAK87646.1 SMC-Scp complex subunit ScpB [Nitrospiraceae bacterium]
MDHNKLPDIIFVILFAAGNTVSYADLSDKLGVSISELISAVKGLQEELKNTPLMLSETDNSIRLVTRPEYGEYIHKFQSERLQRLSDAALEVLAIVVMKQPVTKAEIDNIRDADSEKVMRTLIKGELIREVCRLREPGSPAMYGITDNCLHRFGVKKYEELQGIIKHNFDEPIEV